MEAMRAQALQARDAGEHDRAIGLWRALLARDPDNWRLALELKRDLKSALHNPESDAQFRRAARSLPDAEWVAHNTALYAYHGEDLEALDARARTVLERTPADHRVLAILGEVAWQRRDWAGSRSAFAAAFEASAIEEYRFKRETAAMYLRLEAGETTLTPSRERVIQAISFINLDRNPERETELRRQFARCVPPLIRSAGVEGRRLTVPAVRRLGGDPYMRGTLGCFLSHAGAWEAMIERGDACCLFIEDDVIPLLDLPAALPMPPAFDILFVNNRIAPNLDPAAVSGFTFHTLNAAMTAFHPEENAPGGDGYVLSLEGARKLLAWVEADGFSEDVDWRLIAYGLTPAEIAALPRPSHAGPWLERISQVVQRPERLSAYVLHPPLIRTVGVSSDREDENRLHEQG